MTPKQLRSAAHALRTAANALEDVTAQLRTLSTEIDTPDDLNDPEPAVPAWPTAPYVVWEGDVLRRGGHFYVSAAWKLGCDGLTEEGVYGDSVRQFAREAVPVTVVPSQAWEAWAAWRRSTAHRECHRTEAELINATDVMTGW